MKRKSQRDIDAAIAALVAAKTMLVVVAGGVAYVVEEAIPAGYHVEIFYFDNYRESDRKAYLNALTPEGRAYVKAMWRESL